MKASKDRSEQFMHTTATSSVPQPAGSKSLSFPLPQPRPVLLAVEARSGKMRLIVQTHYYSNKVQKDPDPDSQTTARANRELSLQMGMANRRISWRWILMEIGVRVGRCRVGMGISRCNWSNSRSVLVPSSNCCISVSLFSPPITLYDGCFSRGCWPVSVLRWS